MSSNLTTVNNNKLKIKYPRVYKDIRSRIEKGLLAGMLPGVRQLALEYDVNFMTVNKVIKKLEVDGLVDCIPRKGSYVKRQYSVATCFNDPYQGVAKAQVYHDVVMSAQRYFREHNCPMYLEGSLLNKKDVMHVLSKRIDGLLLFYNENEPLHKDLLSLPCVQVMGSPSEKLNVDHVGYDNAKVGSVAADYLFDSGCRSAAYIGPFISGIFEQRRKVFSEHVKSSGMKYYEFQSGQNCNFDSIVWQVEQLMAQDKFPDAIFSPTDNVMISVCSILYRNSILPGGNIKLIGCDNDDVNISSPEVFASIDLRTKDIGRLAAEQLMKRISNPESPRYKLLLEPKLVLPQDISKKTAIL